MSSPYINHFLQPDTITPGGPQGLNRYSYVSNNPLNFTDPTGHYACGDGEETECGTGKKSGAGYKDKVPTSLRDFEKMTWKERKAWLKRFAKDNNLSQWFEDMAGAIDFMINDPSLAREGGTAEVMDAAVLQAINDGWLLYKGKPQVGGGGQAWAIFFNAYINKTVSDQNELIVLRIAAEQYGVDYGWSLTSTQNAYDNSSELDQIYFTIFKAGADGYRNTATSFRSNPLAVNGAENTLFLGPALLTVTDPRTSGSFLNFVGGFGYPAAVAVWSFANTSPPSSR